MHYRDVHNYINSTQKELNGAAVWHGLAHRLHGRPKGMHR